MYIVSEKLLEKMVLYCAKDVPSAVKEMHHVYYVFCCRYIL